MAHIYGNKTAMGMKVYRAGEFDRHGSGDSEKHEPRRRRPRFGLRRGVFVVFALLFILFVVLAWPFGGQRVVLLGSDARADEASRSDTIVIARAGGGMLAVPRDTLVNIPEIGEDKVNAAFASGGPELTVETLEGLTDRRIGNYIVIDFGGVEEIVNALGGVTVNVEAPIELGMDGGEVVSIPAGEQELGGTEALAFVRYRGDATADIGRIGRQQQFLASLANEATSPAKILRLPGTALAVWRNIDTNMNPIETAFFAARMGLQGIGNAQLYPGTPQYIDGISYWVPDGDAGTQAVEETIG